MPGVNALLVMAAFMPAAELDNNVEWSGITHITYLDRDPLCPITGEGFAAQVRTWANDVSGVNVLVDDGVNPPASVAGIKVGTRGPYDIWETQVPATTSNTNSYVFELVDGTDSDYLGNAGMADTQGGASSYLLDFTTLSHAPLGATPHPGGGTTFRVWAPTPTTAHVRGEFNGWGLTDQMSRDGEFFALHVPAADPGENYKFYFEPGAIWKPDARARRLNPGDNYNSIIYDTTAYAWADQGFQTPAFEDMIIYELHVGTFSGRNDGGTSPPNYRDAVDLHAAHLANLGITAVELMPITEFPWDWSAGYNPVTAWTAESIWGSPDDLKYLVDTLHQNGIAVLVDIVWNHFSGTDNFLWNYDGAQIYFDTPVIETPWGSQADFDNVHVREYFLQSALIWLEEFHVDGFRMDATSFMNPFQASGWSLMQEFNDQIDARWIDKISIAEQLPDDAFVTRQTSQNGAGFDSQWHDRFKWDIRGAIFEAAFGDPSMPVVRSALLGSGTNLEGVKVVNYIEAHDEAWPSSGGQRIIKTIDNTFPHDDQFAQGRSKLGHAMAMLSPGIPLFLMGCEFLEDTDFGAGAPGDPDARLDWTKTSTYSGYFQFFKDMINLRKTIDALRADAPVQINHVNDSDNVLGMHRWNADGSDLMIVFSFNNNALTNYSIGFPQDGEWFEILNSDALEYGGGGLVNGAITVSPVPQDGFGFSAQITVPPSGVVVFSRQPGGPAGAIPAVSEWGVALLALLLLTIGTLVFQRARAAAN